MKKHKRVSILLSLVLLLTMALSNVALAEKVHVVQPGDVLWKIAENHGTDWKTLSQYNNLANPHLIYPNQKIKIPEAVQEAVQEKSVPQAPSTAAESQKPAAKEVTVTVVHTNDTHARIKAGDGMGFAKIATKVNELRAAGNNVLLLDAGDTFHGQPIVTLTNGESAVKVLNTIKYDAMVVGNHDFNYGQDRLVELSQMADFPVLAANVLKEDGTDLLTPYTIKEIKGIKIGIFGLATPETLYKSNPAGLVGLTFEDPVETAKKMVTLLKDQTDVIVALAHLGLEGDFTSEKVAKNVSGLDLIVDGHSHTVLPEGMVINDTLIVQAGEYDKNLGIVELTIKDKKVTAKKASLFTMDEAKEIEEDAAVKAIIAKIDEDITAITSVVVGSTDVKLDGEREQVRIKPTNLSNLITEAMLKASGADVAITNGGGIRASIDVGDITKGDVVTVLPFGNYVVVKEVTGADIVAALENGLSAYPASLGGYSQFAGMKVVFDSTKEAGQRVVEVTVAGEAIDLDRIYRLATNNFMAVGGDQYTMFVAGPTLEELGGLDDILIEHIEKYGLEDAKEDDRILDMGAEEIADAA